MKLALLLQLLLLGGFMLFGVLAAPIDLDVTPFAMVAGLLGAAAMGAHSATSRLVLAHLAPTSMMTGNVTQVVIDAIDALRGVSDGTMAERCAKFFCGRCSPLGPGRSAPHSPINTSASTRCWLQSFCCAV
ncbi:DUF1275 family protein [Undibacterium arcticum]